MRDESKHRSTSVWGFLFLSKVMIFLWQAQLQTKSPEFKKVPLLIQSHLRKQI